jgi:signal transduction histidine kinase
MIVTSMGNDDASSERHAIRTFAAKIGNELNNPLAAIQAAHEYITRRATEDASRPRDARIEAMFGVIDTELANTRRLVADLVDLSSERPLIRTSFIVRDLVAQVERELKRPENVAFVNDVSTDLRAASADRERLVRALRRIARNAVEAIPATRPGCVRVTASIEGDVLSIDVADDGEGIDPSIIDRVSDPLFGTKVKGAGLGLTIAKTLVVEQGGELSCASRVGVGTTFTISLPRA